MSTSTLSSLATTFTGSLSDVFATYLPVVVPVAIGLIVIFGLLGYFIGWGKRKV